MSLLDVQNLKVYFKGRAGMNDVRAVDNVSLDIEKGESLGLVGESGCGKSTLGNAVVKLLPATEGRILYNGADTAHITGAELKDYRRHVQMIFQDPFGSLNPRMPVGEAIVEVLKVHKVKPTEPCKNLNDYWLMKVRDGFSDVGLDPDYVFRYPHEFSGGQRQRIGIARALALHPSLIVADEPVSALDVSVQVQILNLMKDLKDRYQLSYLFIAHDLAVVRYMCERVKVMYLGRIVESAPAAEIFSKPAHPYTQALLSAVPDVDKGLRSRHKKEGRIILKGDVPSPSARISGCPFHPRCHRVKSICSSEEPLVTELSKDHTARCHFAKEFFSA